MHRRTARRLTLFRWGFLLAALVAELVWLTVRFDMQSLVSMPTTSADWLLYAVFLPRFLIACLAAFAILGAGRLKEIISRLSDDSAVYLRWWLSFACHLVAFLGLMLATSWILEDRPRSTALPLVWTAFWFALAAATLGFWIIAFAPIASWERLVRLEYRWLLAGAAAGLAASWAGGLTQRLWEPLYGTTFFTLERLLRAIYGPGEVISRPADRVIGFKHGLLVEISPQCSGYEAFGLVSVLLIVFLWTNRQSLRFPQSLLLIPVGIAIIWLANALRITALIVLGNRWSPRIAVGCFHSPAGWLAFNLIALGLVALALSMPFFSRTGARRG
jgi:exosortase/archaeosortase family protein